MLQKQYLQRILGVQRAIQGKSFVSAVDGEISGFESLCFKPIEGEGCLVESPSQYWLDDPVLLAGDPSPSLTAACQTSDAFLATRSPCMDKVGARCFARFFLSAVIAFFFRSPFPTATVTTLTPNVFHPKTCLWSTLDGPQSHRVCSS